jgi:GMP reductase
MTCLVKTYSVEHLAAYFGTDSDERREYVAMSIGITDIDLEKFRTVYAQVSKGLKYVCIDVANGYSERFSNFVRLFRKEFKNVVIIAGNVVTGEMTEELILNGADIVKVGIGPGSVCTTRIQTGVGYPQLSAVIECADAAHGLGGHIIADGGCSTPGDVAKAFAGGADFVMLGGMLAGHDEGGGEVVDGNIQFYGMSSDA